MNKNENRFYIYGLYEKLEDNLLDNCFYIGKGSGYRMRKHFFSCQLDESNNDVKNLHKVRKIKKLQREDKDFYATKIVDSLSEDKSYELEKFIIEEIGLENLTNMSEGGKGAPSGEQNPMYGKTHSEKARKKISKRHLGRNVSKETKEKMSEAHSGKSLSDEHRKNISEALLGKNSGEDNSMYGKSHSKEVKRKMSESHLKSKYFGGENHPTSKLSESEAREVKWLSKNSNLYQKEIAEIYDIKRVTVSKIKNQKNWSKVDPKKPEDYNE